MSTCPHCKSHTFSLNEIEPLGSRVKMHFVQCGRCNAPFGVVDYFDTSTELARLEDRLKKIEAKMGIYDP